MDILQKVEPTLRALPAAIREKLIFGYSFGRSLVFTSQGLSLPLFEKLLAGTSTVRPGSPQDFRFLFGELLELLRKDAAWLAKGELPLEALEPESPFSFWPRFPRILWDGRRVALRRSKKKSKDLDGVPRVAKDALPEYYLRNFHFQTDGYLSKESAEIYEHQVEILFAGAAGAMRRLILPSLKVFSDQLQISSKAQDRPLRILELGCGTGPLTRLIRHLLPQSKITAVDLSSAYLSVASERMRDLDGISYIEANAGELPFLAESFDAVVSCYLFHELPEEERLRVLSEAQRVLRPGGYLGLIDSIQLCDRSEAEFQEALRRFPIDFHEPFYAHYVKTDLGRLVADSGFAEVETALGFFSKAVSARKSST